MRAAIPGFFYVLVTIFFIFSLPNYVRASKRECAPESDVTKALRRAEKLASKRLGPHEAAELLNILRGEETIADGEVCFSAEDFETFGRILGEFLEYQLLSLDFSTRQDDEDSRLVFTENEDETVSTSQCACIKCQRRFKPWCSAKKAACCPRLCWSIFKAMRVGAIAGFAESGTYACCEKGSIECKALRAKSKDPEDESSTEEKDQRTESASTKSRENNDEPDFDFAGGEEQSESAPSASPSPTSRKQRKDKRKREEDMQFTVASNPRNLPTEGGLDMSGNEVQDTVAHPSSSSAPSASFSPLPADGSTHASLSPWPVVTTPMQSVMSSESEFPSSSHSPSPLPTPLSIAASISPYPSDSNVISEFSAMPSRDPNHAFASPSAIIRRPYANPLSQPGESLQ